MTSNLIPVKTFLGKYYNELLYSSDQEKYKSTGLDSFFDQRFQIQDNRAQIIIDPTLKDYEIIITGNEIVVSKELFDHPCVEIVNSIEQSQITNPKALYQPEIFSTVAYLLCQNHTTIRIVDDVDEPIYIRYVSEFEKFYNSVVVFDIHPGIHVEVVEELCSKAALNVVTNYIIQESASLRLSSFYENLISSSTFNYRNVIAREGSHYNHLLFGQGSATVIDESRIRTDEDCRIEMYGVISSPSENFHKLLYVEPYTKNFHINVDTRLVVDDFSNVTYFPAIVGEPPEKDQAKISVTSLTLENLDITRQIQEVKKFTDDIMNMAVLDRMTGVKRFYNNKTKFQNLHK